MLGSLHHQYFDIRYSSVRHEIPMICEYDICLPRADHRTVQDIGSQHAHHWLHD